MANITERVSACQYRALVGRVASPGARRPGYKKFGNVKTAAPVGPAFDSSKEARTAAALDMARMANDPGMRVVNVERQKRFVVIEKQDGERRSDYVADFVVTYADGRKEVIDVKSRITRRLPVYVLKRKLMLLVHGIRIREV